MQNNEAVIDFRNEMRYNRVNRERRRFLNKGENEMMDFARIVAEQRKKKKMTQEELAQRLGITPQAVSKWENSIGLPDVTLFPMLAEVLELSIEELFGMPKESERRGQTALAPKFFEGLPLLVDCRGMLCYSNKKMKEADDSRVLFCDGSVAELQSGRVINRGMGEIRILKSLDAFVEDVGGEIVTRREEFLPFSSLSLTLSPKCHVKIMSDKKGTPHMLVKGCEKLLDKLEARVQDDMLSIRLESSNRGQSSGSVVCDMEIFVPFECGKQLKLTVNGSGEATVSPSFTDGEIVISGCGAVTAQNFDSFKGSIAGSGEMEIGRVGKQTKLRIAGSGDIKMAAMANPDIQVSGSGDISTEETEGCVKIGIAGSGDVALGSVRIDRADFQISGSGDISMQGEITELKLKVSGSGSLVGDAVTVNRAELTVKGSGDVRLGRIVTESVECLSRDARIQVEHRG